MRDPIVVLKQLSSLKENQRVNDIYCNLYNPEFYKIAYQNIYSKPSQMTPASDRSTIDGMSEERIKKLIQKLRDRTYQPTILRRVYIPKKNGKLRPISIPSLDDKLIQEIIRMLLEALWEPHFLDCSHGFRPKRSCHTALKYTQQKFQGTKWWIEADIKGCFDNINHVILLNLLKKRIREQKFIHLINLFLKAGYVENWQYYKTYSGTPQGSIISPILANIYLHELDKWMINKCESFNKGKMRKRNKEYDNLSKKLWDTKRRLKLGINIEKNKERYKVQRKKWKEERNKNGCVDYKDPDYRRLSYVRYADDFIIGLVGTKAEATTIYNEIKKFLESELLLKMSDEKTKIIHNSDKIRFLGYDISILKSESKPSINGIVCLWLPHDVMVDFIRNNRYGKYTQNKKNGKTEFKAIHRPELINLDELEILMQYNTKIRGLYNYYKMASNVCKMNNFNYICQTSFLKTLAAKFKTSCRKLYKNKNYCQNKHIGITYKTKFYEFFNGPFNVVKNIKYDKTVDMIENTHKYSTRTSLIQRMEAHVCEFCGNTDGPFEVHHVRKLKDLKGKAPWEKLMIARNRKTIVLCSSCHDKLHAGKL